jgi:hypothetical protein
MQQAVDGISVFLFAGFLVSLFIGRGRAAPTH